MKILVTGGAGYIGSFMTRRLLDDKHDVVVVDSLERGNKEYIDTRAKFIQGDLLDKDTIKKVFSTEPFDGVIHFAGYISMGESMQNPSFYFKDNIYSVISLIEGMRENKSNNFIFSSTAGVYGNPTKIPISEDQSKNPQNPYGESKLISEKLLHWYNKIFSINYTCLRYFNASGAALDGSFGENHQPETHIIPNAIRSLLQDKAFMLFGTDYKTDDGTCVRDYIHVLDLVDAHMLALEKLNNDGGANEYNVGTGIGYSNKQIIDMIEDVTEKKMHVTVTSRREGDADILIADPSRIKKELGFNPKYSDLKTIVSSAYKWHTKNR